MAGGGVVSSRLAQKSLKLAFALVCLGVAAGMI
jgi:hypothetical protein